MKNVNVFIYTHCPWAQTPPGGKDVATGFDRQTTDSNSKLPFLMSHLKAPDVSVCPCPVMLALQNVNAVLLQPQSPLEKSTVRFIQPLLGSFLPIQV